MARFQPLTNKNNQKEIRKGSVWSTLKWCGVGEIKKYHLFAVFFILLLQNFQVVTAETMRCRLIYQGNEHMEALGSLLLNFVMGFVNLLILPWHIFQWLLLPTLKAKMNVLLLAGMSQEFFFVVLALVIALIVVGFYRRSVLRTTVYGLETFNGKIGQWASWFALLMMLQQVLIIAMGQIFRGNELMFAPLGMELVNEELQWLSGQLKFYNAILIALASAFTFIEGGHVRVDLIYAAISKRKRQWVDLLGTLFFFIPSTIMLWWFAWPQAVNSMLRARPMNLYSTKASFRSFKWESSGTAEFTWVWSFKFLVVVFAGLMFICAIGFLLRNILALLEKDKDVATHYNFDDGPMSAMGITKISPPASSPASTKN